MLKRVLAVLALLFVLVGVVFADQSLLARSIETSTAEELSAMCRAYGLDASLSESGMRSQLYTFFGIEPTSDDASEPGLLTGESKSENATTILIENADQLYTSDNLVILKGNVQISFSTEAEEVERSLLADKVVVDIDDKLLEASGSVSLSGGDNEDRTFAGDVISLDWGDLDIIVFNGRSTTDRKNSSGSSILFYATGESVSYVNGTNGIFFRKGTIATTEKDPYWSIDAQKLSLAQNDMFVERAVVKLGRVPIFYFPFFVYPGTTLSFNPAIGISSEYGMFLTTTYEVYGRYPKLGVLGTGTSSSSDEETDVTEVSASISSFLTVEDDSEMIHDGFYYRPVVEGEDLGKLESWARGSGSYLAVFADAYDELGLVLGLDTKNFLFDKKLEVSATGAIGYVADQDFAYLRRFRYTFDFNLGYSNDGLKFDFKLPILSDPLVRKHYLNRNTGFALDALMNSEQFFPSTYSKQTEYTWSADASYSKSIGDYNFSISSLKADVDFELDTTTVDGDTFYKAEVEEASLPYLSLSSSGTFFDFQGNSRKTTKTKDYTSPLAKSFSDELNTMLTEEAEASEVSEASDASDTEEASNPEATTEETSTALVLKPYSGPELDLEETTTSAAGGIKLGYTYNQSLDNSFTEDLDHDSFYTKLSGTLYVDGSLPGKWLAVKETLKPQFNYSKSSIATDSPTTVDEFYLTSTLNAQIPRFGITYNLTNKIYNHYNSVTSSETSLTDRWGEWNSTDVTAHNASISKTLGSFTFGFYSQFRPLTEILKPSAKFSRSGFTASLDFSFQREEDETKFEKGEGNLNLSYSNSHVTASLANNYDFTEVEDDAWEGYTLVQKLSVTPVKGLTFTESGKWVNRFEASTLSLGAAYKLDTERIDLNTSATMTFKDKDYDKDALKLSVKLSQDELSWWKNRMSFQQSMTLDFNYDFDNPYKTAFTMSYSFSFSIAEFLDMKVSVNSANKSFSRYLTEDSFSFSKLLEDLWKSFDFFGNGRRSTGFNLSSFSVAVVHYMRDWNLYIDAQGSLTTKYSGKYEWVPTVTVYIKWNAIPELKADGSWDSSTRQWN